MQRFITSHKLSDRQVLSLNAFVDNFYRLTDDSAAHSEYASQFLPGATLIVNHKVVQGEEGIISFRNSVWSLFLSQKHIIEEVVYNQKPSTKIEGKDYETVETILFGTVTTVSKDGKQQMVNWAGRAEYVSENNIEWNVSQYHVYVNDKQRVAFKM